MLSKELLNKNERILNALFKKVLKNNNTFKNKLKCPNFSL